MRDYRCSIAERCAEVIHSVQFLADYIHNQRFRGFLLNLFSNRCRAVASFPEDPCSRIPRETGVEHEFDSQVESFQDFWDIQDQLVQLPLHPSEQTHEIRG